MSSRPMDIKIWKGFNWFPRPIRSHALECSCPADEGFKCIVSHPVIAFPLKLLPYQERREKLYCFVVVIIQTAYAKVDSFSALSEHGNNPPMAPTMAAALDISTLCG